MRPFVVRVARWMPGCGLPRLELLSATRRLFARALYEVAVAFWLRYNSIIASMA